MVVDDPRRYSHSEMLMDEGQNTGSHFMVCGPAMWAGLLSVHQMKPSFPVSQSSPFDPIPLCLESSQCLVLSQAPANQRLGKPISLFTPCRRWGCRDARCGRQRSPPIQLAA